MKKFNSDERHFLLDNDCGDLVLNAPQVDIWKKHKKYIYVSDILEKYKRHVLIQRTTADIWLRLSAFAQIILRITSYMRKR